MGDEGTLFEALVAGYGFNEILDESWITHQLHAKYLRDKPNACKCQVIPEIYRHHFGEADDKPIYPSIATAMAHAIGENLFYRYIVRVQHTPWLFGGAHKEVKA